MQYNKLSAPHLKIKRWRDKRNALVGKLMAEDKTLLSAEALRLANRILRGKEKKRS